MSRFALAEQLLPSISLGYGPPLSTLGVSLDWLESISMYCSWACDTVWANNTQGKGWVIYCSPIQEWKRHLGPGWCALGTQGCTWCSPFGFLDEGYAEDDIGVQRRPEWRKSWLVPWWPCESLEETTSEAKPTSGFFTYVSQLLCFGPVFLLVAKISFGTDGHINYRNGENPWPKTMGLSLTHQIDSFLFQQKGFCFNLIENTIRFSSTYGKYMLDTHLYAMTGFNPQVTQ